MLFADKSGCHTNMKKDGNIGNRKYIVQRGDIPQTPCCTNEHRFTILPFTSGSGEAVCCVIIFQKGSPGVPMNWKTGIDETVTPFRNTTGNPDYCDSNMGDGKYYPGGPKCNYKGKEVDCLTFVSKSGGITGGILVEILKYFDLLGLFPRVPGGPIPVLILNGHQSHLDPSFTKYINGQDHEWRVCLGVHYATVLW